MAHSSQRFLAVGFLLAASALAIVTLPALYIAFAPKTYSSRAKGLIRPRVASAPPIRLQDLPLESFRHDRNVMIQSPRSSSIIEIIAFAPEPETAAKLANQHALELQGKILERLNADFALIESATPNSQAVRPAKKKILIIAGTTALNLGLAGAVCLLIGFWKRRHQATVIRTVLAS